MTIFNLSKKKKDKNCCCNGNCNSKTIANVEQAKTNDAVIKILGGGCKKCNDLEANTKVALKELGLELTVGHITDFTQIASLGVMTTPALMIGDKIASFGKVLSVAEVKVLLLKSEVI